MCATIVIANKIKEARTLAVLCDASICTHSWRFMHDPALQMGFPTYVQCQNAFIMHIFILLFTRFIQKKSSIFSISLYFYCSFDLHSSIKFEHKLPICAKSYVLLSHSNRFKIVCRDLRYSRSRI